MLLEASEKADVLIEAMKWIREHRGKITVVKLGGSLMEDEDAMMHLITDLVFMETVGMKPVVVHGGGAAISQAMTEAGVVPHFVQGRRYTDEATLKVVKEVLAKKISTGLVEQIKFYGGSAVALSDALDTNVLYGRKATLKDDSGQEVDLGWVGEVTRVDVDKIVECCNRGEIPIIPSYTVVDDGGRQGLNVNADVAATEVAKQLHANKLIFVSEVNGVRTDPNDPNSMINSLTADEARKLLASGAIVGGMIPKIQSCLKTIERGVEKIHIINGRLRHSILLEIFTSQGVGTEIVDKRDR
ncbi:MAG: acetylglutamate kinase [Thermoguttaceae bacterium]|nr:acetylglutamate kinase [Thermoguttaceae bacterium]MBQ2040099.1 acetylglutamate kinase [Thermoguttaceae bacterium]MBQ2556580.1 acetylglutamate kinase [Thermoguttaceae bacterium]MBQ3822794.1 acetylglutamate kinase [Thermoguttaceae bacterium]MBQ4080521.1 acetylglutamate kinase [Thermoguttaceae bacterium]